MEEIHIFFFETKLFVMVLVCKFYIYFYQPYIYLVQKLEHKCIVMHNKLII